MNREHELLARSNERWQRKNLCRIAAVVVGALSLFILLSTSLYAQTSSGTPVKLVYWSTKDCVQCDAITINGITYRIFKTSDIYLSFTMGKHDNHLVADVFLVNRTTRRIEFNPEQAVIIVWDKQSDIDKQRPGKEYPPVPPEKIIKQLESRAMWANALLGLSAAMQTQTVTTDATVVGTSESAIATATTTVPDQGAQQRAGQQQQQNTSTARSKTALISDQALRANTLFPQQQILGRIYFPKKKIELMYLGIRVEDALYLIAFGK